MIEIANAPHIREAEAFGCDDPEPVRCPCCCCACETLFMAGDEVLGCENCITVADADEWAEKHGRC